MKKYAFASIEIKGFLGKTDEHQQIINKYAANGYRYVGYIPTSINNDGKINSLDLIFEIDC